jgi:hypothetical protein
MATFSLTDTSHVLKSGGDVQTEYVEILPRLASGILVWPGNYRMHHPKKARATFPEFKRDVPAVSSVRAHGILDASKGLTDR